MDTHLSMVSNRLNVVMKQLAVIATVFLPLGFLTGFFGQNFAWPIAHLQSGLASTSSSSASAPNWSRSSCCSSFSSGAAGSEAGRQPELPARRRGGAHCLVLSVCSVCKRRSHSWCVSPSRGGFGWCHLQTLTPLPVSV